MFQAEYRILYYIECDLVELLSRYLYVDYKGLHLIYHGVGELSLSENYYLVILETLL